MCNVFRVNESKKIWKEFGNIPPIFFLQKILSKILKEIFFKINTAQPLGHGLMNMEPTFQKYILQNIWKKIEKNCQLIMVFGLIV
jgi:hypothetical protein